MIKLQLLLCQAAQQPDIEPDLRARLEAHGLHVTACGRATVTVEATAAVAESLFGPLPPLQSGFALLSAPDLPVPGDLTDAIRAISIAPQHAATRQPT